MEPITAPVALPVLQWQYQPHVYSGSHLRGSVPVVQRILFRLARNGVDITDPEPCWPWPGALTNGYGRLASDPTGETYVHRIMFRECIGPIPEGHEVEHGCHNRDPLCRDGATCQHRRCCNPTHFAGAVTHVENHRRRRTDERGLPCANGPHEFVARPRGQGCRVCFNAYHWAYRRGFRGDWVALWQSPIMASYRPA